MDMYLYIYTFTYIYVYRRLGGVSSPLGRPPRNREIVSCRACVRAVNARWKCTSNVIPAFSLFPLCPGAFPFSLVVIKRNQVKSNKMKSSEIR